MKNRLLVKLLPTVSLAAANPRANLRPLFESAPQTAAFGIGAAPAWFIADVPEEAATPWDLAHGQVHHRPVLRVGDGPGRRPVRHR